MSSDRDELAKFAVLQSLYKRLGEMLGTKNPDNLRGHADADLLDLWEHHGVDRQRLQIGDTTIGYLVLKFSKATKKAVIIVTDPDALAQEDEALVRMFVRHYADKFANFVLEVTGAVPDGCEMRVDDVPSQCIGTTVTGCKPEDVFPLLGADGIAGYLKEA